MENAGEGVTMSVGTPISVGNPGAESAASQDVGPALAVPENVTIDSHDEEVNQDISRTTRFADDLVDQAKEDGVDSAFETLAEGEVEDAEKSSVSEEENIAEGNIVDFQAYKDKKESSAEDREEEAEQEKEEKEGESEKSESEEQKADAEEKEVRTPELEKQVGILSERIADLIEFGRETAEASARAGQAYRVEELYAMLEEILRDLREKEEEKKKKSPLEVLLLFLLLILKETFREGSAEVSKNNSHEKTA